MADPWAGLTEPQRRQIREAHIAARTSAPADFCQPCARVTASQPCPGCGQPACAACRNCPACDLDPLTEAVLTNARILRERREAGND